MVFWYFDILIKVIDNQRIINIQSGYQSSSNSIQCYRDENPGCLIYLRITLVKCNDLSTGNAKKFADAILKHKKDATKMLLLKSI